MSVAGFIKELLSDDMYDNDFNERIMDRVNAMNAAQLQGMYNYLQGIQKDSKSKMWASVNAEIISKMEGKMQFMIEQEAKKQAKIQEEKLKAKQKVIIANEAKREKKRVLKMIIDTAQKAAAEEVKEEENQRQAAEKVVIMQKTFIAEERRNKWWKYTAAIYLVVFIIICVVVTYIYVLIGALFFITFVAAYALYHAYKFTDIPPEEVPPEVIQARIREKQDAIKQEKISQMVDKEINYQRQVARDKLDKKKRIADRKAKQALEIQLMEKRRLEQIALAKQALAQSQSKSSKMTLDRLHAAERDFNEDEPENLEDDPDASMMITTHAGKLTRGNTTVNNPFDRLEMDDVSQEEEKSDDEEDFRGGGSGDIPVVFGHDRIAKPGEEGEEESEEDEGSLGSLSRGRVVVAAPVKMVEEDEEEHFVSSDGDEENQILAVLAKEKNTGDKRGDVLDQRPESILSKKKKPSGTASSKVSFRGTGTVAVAANESKKMSTDVPEDDRLATMV